MLAAMPFGELTADDKFAWMLRDPDGYFAAARRARREELAPGRVAWPGREQPAD